MHTTPFHTVRAKKVFGRKQPSVSPISAVSLMAIERDLQRELRRAQRLNDTRAIQAAHRALNRLIP